MARIVLLKIITIALAVYVICLSDFFLPPEGDIVSVLMVLCIDPGLLNKVADLSSLLGFTGITTISNCSQNRTQRRLREIKVSLNHSSSDQHHGKSTCQSFTPNLTASGWFSCKADTTQRQALNQEPPQVSKILILISDRRIITGVSGLKIHMLPLRNSVDATWSDNSPNGMKPNKCYMEVQLQNSTVDDLTDQNRYLCTEKNCNCVVKKGVANDPCYRGTSNYLAMTIQEQNCVLEIIWLALFPTICIVLLIVISYQLLKEDSSCNVRNCRLGSDYPQGVYDYGNHLMSGVTSRQREAATNINEIQQERGRSQSHVYEACSREHQFISSDQGENARQDEAAVYISEVKQEGRRMQSPVGACSREYQYIDSVLGDKNLSKEHGKLSIIPELEGAHSNNEGYCVKTLPPNNSKGQISENVSADEYANVDSATNRASSTPRHLLGANKRQHERPLYINEIQQEGSRKQPSGHEACSRENQHVEPIIVYQGTYDSVHIYGNIEERGSVAASRHEYANVLDLAGDEAFLTSQHLPDTLDLHCDRHHNIKAATQKKKRKFLCF